MARPYKLTKRKVVCTGVLDPLRREANAPLPEPAEGPLGSASLRKRLEKRKNSSKPSKSQVQVEILVGALKRGAVVQYSKCFLWGECWTTIQVISSDEEEQDAKQPASDGGPAPADPPAASAAQPSESAKQPAASASVSQPLESVESAQPAAPAVLESLEPALAKRCWKAGVIKIEAREHGS